MKGLYTGHLPKGLRDFKKPNFGLGARQLDRALINASLEQLDGVKNNTHKARLPACRNFAEFLKEHTDVKRLNMVEKRHVELYGEYLRERFESEESLSASSARDYLSHINVCLSQARGDKKLKVEATKDLHFPPKSGIATEDRSVTQPQHDAIVSEASDEIVVIAKLQRHFGFRFREAALFDSSKALSQYEKTGLVSLSRGTKGGQARTLTIDSDEQVKALALGHKLQLRTGHDNAIPQQERLQAFQCRAWREVKAIDEGYLSHGERKFFACDYYTKRMGVAPPVIAGIQHGKAHHEYIAKTLSISLGEAIEKDKAVRLELSKLLGHHRVGITNAYLG
ncbi:integrase domain-containing protein [Vibrio breoganii]|uniref:integrase domain-containing protein n=1 Tax=Vibrio breoganii TaxID=553239 RepID=UPI0021C3EFC1|nr:integrase domain-containing protein [Vibrio breoganii]MDN3717754.1 integrase domain-containing protein [Vibrio breoganii]